MLALIEAFQTAELPDAALDARVLFCAAAEIEHIDLIRDPDVPIGEEAGPRLTASLRRRLEREPVSRILGQRGFWSLDIAIGPEVLDPRADSEALIDAALQVFSERQHHVLRIADLGTGSGALLCALLDIFPNAQGVALDISAPACAIARRNLLRCGFQGRFSIVNGDWEALQPDRFDLIISNPPYINTGDIPGLDPEVRNFDPHLALDGGVDGLNAYRRIIPLLPKLLAPAGIAILEIGYQQAETVIQMLGAYSLRFLGMRSDHGGNPRAILAMIEDNSEPISAQLHNFAP